MVPAIGWLVLPIDYGVAATIVPVLTAVAVSILHLVRLTRLGGRARTNPPVG